MTVQPIRAPLLESRGVEHGFGVRGARPPGDLRRPTQVHGTRVAHSEHCVPPNAPEADAIVSDESGVAIGVVTADCVPILVAARGGRAVAAVHAGWRGLAAGVIAASVAALREIAGDRAELVAAIGPRIGPCCYEVDAPVLDALAEHFGDWPADAWRVCRPGHALLDLGALARRALEREGFGENEVDLLSGVCTRCDAERFHSYRRDGSHAGRLVHFIRAARNEA